MNCRKTLFLILVTFLWTRAEAQDMQKTVSGELFQRTGGLRAVMLEPVPAAEDVPVLMDYSSQGGKSPGLGALFSALVPGTGEMYAGSWLKGAIFLGAEIGLWVGYWQFHKKGGEWEDIFQAFADDHWSEDRWRDWMQNHPEFGDTTHTLPSTKTQQYYEMIGKYNQFKAGWDDYTEGGAALTPNRNYYEDLRDKSNDQFKRASYCAMISLGNHVLSALDAALTVRLKNRTLKGQVRMGLKNTLRETVPVAVLRMSW
jgi:hypothetical protein